MATAKRSVKKKPVAKAAPRSRRRSAGSPARRRTGLGNTNMEDMKAKWIDRLLIAGTSVGVVAAGYLGIKKLYKSTVGEIVYNKQLTQVTQSGKPAYYANQLAIAFSPSGSERVSDWFGDGTDENAVLAILKDIPSAAVYNDMTKSYHTLTGRKFNEDLRSELTSIWGNEDYLAAMKIIESKK